MELRSGAMDPIFVFDSTVFGVGPAGLWRYQEKDRSWSCVRPRFKPTTLIQAGSRFFALSGDSTSESGVFRSSDGGTTWVSLLAGLARPDSLELANARRAVFLGRYLVVGTVNAVYRSADSGATWVKVSEAGIAITSLKGAGWLFRHGATLIAADNEAVYRSADSGASGSWTYLGPTPTGSGGAFLEMMSIGKYRVANAVRAGGGAGIYRSADGGETWNGVNSNFLMRMNAGDPYLYALNWEGDRFLMRSDDSGKIWSRIHDTLSFENFGVAGNTLYGVTWDNFLIRSTDGGVHFAVVAPAPNMSILELASGGTGILAGTLNEGMFRSPEEAAPTSDGGSKWTYAGYMGQGIPSISIQGAEILVRDVFTLDFTGDRGKSWMNLHAYASIVPEPYVRSVFLSDQVFFMVAAPCIYRSADAAKTWECVHPGYGEDLFRNPIVFQRLGADLFLGDSAGVHRSSDKGKTWTRTASGLNGSIRAMTAVGNLLFAAGEGGLYRSANRGESWVRKSTDAGYHLLLAQGLNLFAAKAGVAYRSLDEGTTWSRFDEGMLMAGRPISDSITALTSTASALYVGAIDAGVWRRPFGEILPVSVHKGSLPDLGQGKSALGSDLSMRRSASGLTVDFSLSEAAHIRMELFDLRGNRCAPAAEAVLAPGARDMSLAVPPASPACIGWCSKAGGAGKSAD